MVDVNDAVKVYDVAKQLSNLKKIPLEQAIEIVKVTELGKIKAVLRAINQRESYFYDTKHHRHLQYDD